jgi:ALG3 protein
MLERTAWSSTVHQSLLIGTALPGGWKVLVLAIMPNYSNMLLHICRLTIQVCSSRAQTATPAQLAAGVVAGAALQGALAAPFLAAAPMSYASKAFELSRVFLHRWTVNLKFLPEAVFQRCFYGALGICLCWCTLAA